LKKKRGILLITADHGNAEQMIDKRTGEPHTAHTDNPVPFIVLNFSKHYVEPISTLGELADIAPWILKQMLN
jgi:2,3-bisphosphoglycerate-independent phosphoglycerate mutase